MLAFAALAPPGYGEALLAEHRAAIELLRLLLTTSAARTRTCSTRWPRASRR